VYSALETLKELQGARKVAILGDMLELGKYAVEAHVKVGEAARQSANLVISVGLRSRGMNAQHHFNTSIEAAEKVPALLRDGDIVLVKGSQGIRMERVVKALLDPSLNSKDYLVRQEPEWLSR
jgi:UDP-N-acetylmuramoyl-tripeptide--D-alanyl-D-alanine ligase